MSGGVWNTGVLDIVLPSDGILAPLTGSIYIGGPRLDPSLTAIGVVAAIVFYSQPGDTSNTEFYFIGVVNRLGLTSGLLFGSKYIGDPVVKQTEYLLQSIPADTSNSKLYSVSNYSVTASKSLTLATQGGSGSLAISPSPTGTSAWTGAFNQISLTSATIFMGAVGAVIEFFNRTIGGGINQVEMGGLGTRPYLKAVGSTITDVWQQGTSVQSCNGTNCNVSWEWRLTMDGWVDLRYKIEPVAGTVATGGFAVTFTSVTASYQANGSDPLGLVVRDITRVAGGTNGFAPNALVGNVLNIDNTGVTAGANCTGFYGQFSYSTDK